MKYDDLIVFLGNNVTLELENKTLNGNIVSCEENSIKIETDFGVIEIPNEKIIDINKNINVQSLNVFVCRNEVLGCKGVRMLSSKDEPKWKCKYLNKFNCPVKKVCDFNSLPINIKLAFLDGLHSEVPVIENTKNT